MFSLEELFYRVDTFCQACEPQWQQQLLTHHLQTRQRSRQLCLSEIMTILIAFHQQGYRTFKDYYLKHVCCYWSAAFPGLVSYQRFVSWMPSVLLPLCAYLRSCFGVCSGISFIDSTTSLKVCHNRRIKQHRVFENLAARGKTSVDWFFGFKLHLVFNDQGELLNFTLTPGNTDDRTPVPQLLAMLFGKVFGDKGYLSKKLSQQLLDTVGVQLITHVHRNMKNRLTALEDRLLLRKRAGTLSVSRRQRRDDHRPTQEHLPNRAFAPSFSHQLLGQFSLWLDCLLPSTEEALDCTQRQFTPCCLTRTDVT